MGQGGEVGGGVGGEEGGEVLRMGIGEGAEMVRCGEEGAVVLGCVGAHAGRGSGRGDEVFGPAEGVFVGGE